MIYVQCVLKLEDCIWVLGPFHSQEYGKMSNLLPGIWDTVFNYRIIFSPLKYSKYRVNLTCTAKPSVLVAGHVQTVQTQLRRSV